MALFRRRTPEVLKKTTQGELVEERKKFRIGGQTVEVRRVEEPETQGRSGRSERPRPDKKRSDKKHSGRPESQQRGTPRGRTNGRAPVEDEIIIPTDVGRRQMLVRSA